MGPTEGVENLERIETEFHWPWLGSNQTYHRCNRRVVGRENKGNAKKYRQCGIEPDFEEKMDIMFQGAVATGKHSSNPSESGFSGIPGDLPSEPVMLEDDVLSINQKDLDTSNSSKKPRLAREKKDNDDMIKILIDRVVDAFAAPPPAAPPDTSIKECIIILDDMPEAVSDMKFYGNCVKKLEDYTRRQIFMALRPQRRIAYLRALAED